MTAITREAFIKAFAAQPAAAEKLARAIDALGAGKSRDDGQLTTAEIRAALRRARDDGFQGEALKEGFETLFGKDFLTGATPAGFQQTVRTQQAVYTITDQDLLADLRTLSKDPRYAVRDAASAEYEAAAKWVAGELEKAGAKPLGDGSGEGRSFLQKFRWEDRFRRGTVSKSSNVVGVLPGKGKEPRQAVLVIAHLDNISAAERADYTRREGRQFPSYEGANDNTASVAALLEVARALPSAGKTDKDIIFLVPSAEEDGLKGTEAFVKAPPVPLDNIVGAVNLEMIGRNTTDQLLVYGGATDSEAQGNPLYRRAMNVAAQSGTTVRPGLQNDDGEDWYHRSDHLVTQNAGIPSVMFHGRTAPGNYHTADDTVERLNLEKVRVVAQQVLRLVSDLGNDTQSAERRGPPKASLNHFPGRVWAGE